MLALASLGINYGNLMSGAIGPQPSRERSGHLPQRVVIEVGVSGGIVLPNVGAPEGIYYMNVMGGTTTSIGLRGAYQDIGHMDVGDTLSGSARYSAFQGINQGIAYVGIFPGGTMTMPVAIPWERATVAGPGPITWESWSWTATVAGDYRLALWQTNTVARAAWFDGNTLTRAQTGVPETGSTLLLLATAMVAVAAGRCGFSRR